MAHDLDMIGHILAIVGALEHVAAQRDSVWEAVSRHEDALL